MKNCLLKAALPRVTFFALLFINTFYFSLPSAFAQVPTISSESLPEFDSFMAMTAKGNIVYMLGVAKPLTGQTQGNAVLAKFENEKWVEIPVVKFENGIGDTLKLQTSSGQMLLDRSGLLWISAGIQGLWKFDGSTWSTFKLNDNFASERRYGAMTCDSSGNIWVMTQIFNANEQSALLKFDGVNFDVIQKSNSGLSFGGFGRQQIVTKPDGNVVWHYFRTKSKNHDDTDRAELFFYKNGQIDSANAETYDKTEYSKSINDIQANTDNSLFFNYSKRTSTVDGKQVTFGGGLSIYNPDGTWKHFTIDEGLPKVNRFSKLPADIYSGTRDKNGIWWFGGQGAIFTVNNQKEINIPEWNQIQRNATLFKSEGAPSHWAESVLKGMWDTTITSRPNFYSIAATDNGDIWVMIQPFIMRISSEITSIKNNWNNVENWNVYPNPTYENITISFPQNLSFKNTKVILRDITGREMFLKEINALQDSYTFSVHEIPTGVYLLEVRSGSEFFTRQVSVIR